MNLTVFLASLLSLLISCANGYKVFFLSEECQHQSFVEIHMRSLESNSSGILKSSRNGDFIEDLHCEIRLKPPLSYGVVLGVRIIDMPPDAQKSQNCYNYIEIHEDEGDSPTRLCGYSNDALEYDSYESSGPMKLVFHTNSSGTVHNGTKLQFQLTFTAFRRAKLWCPKEEFHCRNERCIWRGLMCDGHNNCGDLSDETGPAKCGKSLNLTQSVAIVVGTIVLCIIFVTGITCLRRYLIGSRFQRLTGQNCPDLERNLADGYQSVSTRQPAINSRSLPRPSDAPPKYEDILAESSAATAVPVTT